ncbi:MAG: hypothetical protein H7232_19135 [Aeromicrobium sp.]|nr:hypothetical protein [Burkholderiales bacterium]
MDAHADKVRADADAFVWKAQSGDAGAPFEPEALAAFRVLKIQNVANWMRVRERLKKCCVSVTELDKRLHSGDGGGHDLDRSAADQLIVLARRECRLVHDARHEAYAVFEFGGARQVHSLSSQGFGEFLTHRYSKENGRAPPDSALVVAPTTLRGQCRFEGELVEVFTRIGKSASGYWLDLCNEKWQCVLITAHGWSLREGEGCPLFTRSRSMRPLPMPVGGGTMDALWSLVNIPVDDRVLVLVWLLECMRADTPFPVLELTGEQGSIKSTTQKFLRRLIDPNQADLRSAPRSVEDVWIAAHSSHMVSLENLSHLSSDYQDALCVLATGGAFATRTLYTNVEETVIELCKPIILNGINAVVTSQDLVDRCVHIDLPIVLKRLLAGDVNARFEGAWPELLGALLDLFSEVLKTLPTVHIDPERRPRMADFAYLGEALMKAQGEQDGAFVRLYDEKRKQGIHRTVDACAVGAALMSHFERQPGWWRGTLSQLLILIEPFQRRGDAWPKSPRALGDVLRRVSPALRQLGFKCEAATKHGGVIFWEIASPQQSPEHPDQTVVEADLRTRSGRAGHLGHPGHGDDTLVVPNDGGFIEDYDDEVF